MRRLSWILLLLFTIFFGLIGFHSVHAAASKGMVVVANKGDNALGIIDVPAGKQIAEVPEGGVTGHEVIVSRDGKIAYVPIYGNSGVGMPGTDGSNMVVIDLASHKVV